jgi:predicted transcriptional regulator
MKIFIVKRGDHGPLTKEYGITLEEAGKQLGLTVSAVSKMMSRDDSGLSS